MAEALEQHLQLPELQALSFEERFDLLVDREVAVRDNHRLTGLLATSITRVLPIGVA